VHRLLLTVHDRVGIVEPNPLVCCSERVVQWLIHRRFTIAWGSWSRIVGPFTLKAFFDAPRLQEAFTSRGDRRTKSLVLISKREFGWLVFTEGLRLRGDRGAESLDFLLSKRFSMPHVYTMVLSCVEIAEPNRWNFYGERVLIGSTSTKGFRHQRDGRTKSLVLISKREFGWLVFTEDFCMDGDRRTKSLDILLSKRFSMVCVCMKVLCRTGMVEPNPWFLVLKAFDWLHEHERFPT